MDRDHAEINKKLDRLVDMVSDIQQDRAVLKDNVLKLEGLDAGTRLTKIETSRKTMGKVLIAAFSGIGCLIGVLRYFG